MCFLILWQKLIKGKLYWKFCKLTKGDLWMYINSVVIIVERTKVRKLSFSQKVSVRSLPGSISRIFDPVHTLAGHRFTSFKTRNYVILKVGEVKDLMKHTRLQFPRRNRLWFILKFCQYLYFLRHWREGSQQKKKIRTDGLKTKRNLQNFLQWTSLV